MAAEIVSAILPAEFSIKPKQLSALESIIENRDTLCILPTGYGKSLIYQLIPSVFKKIEYKDMP